ncbi:MAG: hypothetical protein HC828_11790 [Blastochloris sp.]|nr:hypothetical protein [Blastochloris sp.]
MIDILEQANLLLAATVLIVTFSLLAYITLQNWRSDIARALLALLAGVVIVYGGDLLLDRAVREETKDFLGRAQWIGIAVVPAAYLHLANALFALSQHNRLAKRSRWLIWAGYGGSAIFMLLVATGTNLVIRGQLPSGPVAQFQAGSLFWVFGGFFLIAGVVTFAAILDSRRSAITPTQRRRLTYLGATYAAPGIGVFPFLVLGVPTDISPVIILVLQGMANIIVTIMLTVMTYSVAFQGVLLPDRLIKQDFIRWWLYGPFVGITIILFMQAIPIFEGILGLPRDTLLTFGVMIMTVLMPIFVSRIKPYFDTLIYTQDMEEIDYLRNLPRVTFTRADLRALLENSLVAICEVLQIRSGFVLAPNGNGFTVKAIYGSRREVKRLLSEYPLEELVPQIERLPSIEPDSTPPIEAFLSVSSFCILPLRSPDGVFIGALGCAIPPEQLQQNGKLMDQTRHLIGTLAHQMELAVSTVQIQQRIFDALRGLGPEMQSLHQISTRLEQATPATLTSFDGDVTLTPEFPQLVKDALTQFWGGPKLADSPLLSLRTVRKILAEQGGSPTRALQAVLRQAISNLRPDEQIDPSAQEWLLYHLLEGRFLQRKTVRDVASKLAMSESDFYRKQRAAVEEVARQIALMEDGEQ